MNTSELDVQWAHERRLLLAYRLAEAKTAIEQNYERVKTQYGENSAQGAGCLLHLGLWHEANGDYAAAEPLLRQSEQQLRRHSQTLLPKAMQAQFYYARVLSRQGKWQMAQEQLSSVLRQQRQYYEYSDHEDIAHTLRLSGNVQMVQPERQDDALLLLEQSAAMFERLHGMNHPDTAYTYTQIAERYAQQGYVEQAQSIIRSTDAILREQWGAEHPHVAFAQWQWAICCDLLQQHNDAKKHFAQAEHSLRNSVGDEHPFLADLLMFIAAHYLARGQVQAALGSYENALWIYIQRYDEEHPAIAHVIRQIAQLVQPTD